MINYYDFKIDNKIVASIDRSYADAIYVELPCGYSQRFWADFTDEQAVDQTKLMKKKKIKSS